MMRKLLVLAVVSTMLIACGPKKLETKEDYIAAVVEFEDSLKANAVDVNQLTDQAIGVSYAEKCLAVYRQFPKTKEAPRYLDKAHVIFASLGMHQRSVLLADTLIRNYPLYKNRPMVLESLATAYDIFLRPRNKEKVKMYYEMLLKEGTNLPAEQRENITFRLKNIDLSFEELIDANQAQ
jgi:hypothetical protein